jgi:HPt (histidine-containing phosphotransfer) domain-containing protein
MQDLRNIVNQSGYGTRVSDQALNEIVQARDPRQAAEQLVTRLGGRPRDFTQVIDRIVQVCSENRTMQDAPAASEGESTVTEYADRLRTVAAGMGLPAAQVEEALRQAGMVQDETENGESDDDSFDAIGQEVVRLMKKMLKKLDKIANSL